MENQNPQIQPLSEEALLLEIGRIVQTQRIFSRAVERIRTLLEQEAHGKTFVVELSGSEPKQPLLSTSNEIQDFLASIELPYRSLYSVPLESAGKEFGKLVACFASPRFLGDTPRRIAAHAAEQLGFLLAAQYHPVV